jgi:hypothetical protein
MFQQQELFSPQKKTSIIKHVLFPPNNHKITSVSLLLPGECHEFQAVHQLLQGQGPHGRGQTAQNGLGGRGCEGAAFLVAASAKEQQLLRAPMAVMFTTYIVTKEQ